VLDADHSAVTVVIICAVRIVAEAMSRFLEEAGLAVAGVAAGMEEGLAEIRRSRAKVTLVDVAQGMPAVREIVLREPKCKVVLLGLSETEDDPIEWLALGAAAYVGRDASLEVALRALNGAAAGEAFFSARIAGKLAQRLRELTVDKEFVYAAHGLTTRELEVLGLLEQGYSNKEVARRLSIEVGTVKNHVHNLLQKLQLHRRGEASAWLRRHQSSGRGDGGDPSSATIMYPAA
jgi:DNA-binding NarL/FixJ family response regulator